MNKISCILNPASFISKKLLTVTIFVKKPVIIFWAYRFYDLIPFKLNGIVNSITKTLSRYLLKLQTLVIT